MISLDSIKAKLKKIAVSEGKQFDYLLTLYVIERMIYRISISKYSDKFILKGGLLMYTILDEKARVTKAVDLLAKEFDNSIENISRVFHEIIGIEADDAIKFDIDSLTAEKIKEDADYEGVRIKIVAYLDRTRKVLQMDIM